MTRYRYDRDLGCVVEIRDGSNYFEEPRGPQIIRDIEPYRTVAADVANEGKRAVIGGRRQHREFLKRNGYVEVGNERQPSRKPISLDRQKRVDTIKFVYDMCKQGRQAEIPYALGSDRNPFGGRD